MESLKDRFATDFARMLSDALDPPPAMDGQDPAAILTEGFMSALRDAAMDPAFGKQFAWAVVQAVTGPVESGLPDVLNEVVKAKAAAEELDMSLEKVEYRRGTDRITAEFDCFEPVPGQAQ